MPTYPSVNEPITPTVPVVASLVSPIVVPTHGPGGHFSVLAKTHIAAPPSLVIQTVRNTREWFKWNSFCPRCTIDSGSPEAGPLSNGDPALETGNEGWFEVGSVAVIDVFMNGDGLVKVPEEQKKKRTQGIVITRLEKLTKGDKEGIKKGYKIAWKSTGYSHWQLHSERVMEFVEGNGGTDYVCWETFGGLLGSVVKATVGGQLADRFGDYARDLKAYVEYIAKVEVQNGSA